MILAVADTHAFLWYLYDDPRLSPAAGALIDAAVRDGEEIAISTISLIESVYLVEKQRIPSDAYDLAIWELHAPGKSFVKSQSMRRSLLRCD